jgi:hypothetical protein
VSRPRGPCLAALAIAGLVAGEAAAAPPACLARASSVPPEGRPGQQLIWRLEILRRADVSAVEWLEPPGFPGFRAEWLPGQPELPGVIQDGVEYAARVEERALFPERAGEFLIAPKGLRCQLADGTAILAGIPATRIQVAPLPERGRPPDFGGLVGRLVVEAQAHPRRLALGASVRLEVTLHGDANLWDARDPLAGAAGLADVEVFPQRPRLELDHGAQLFVRRVFVYDLVPAREGRLEIPALRVPYFDPQAGGYAEARAPALLLTVLPRPAAREGPTARADALEPASSRPPWLLPGAGTLLALALAGGLVLRRRRRARAAGIPAPPGATAGADEPTRLARALRAALAPRLPGALAATVEELRAAPGAGPAVERALCALASLERSRFDPTSPPVPRAEVEAAIRALAGDAQR